MTFSEAIEWSVKVVEAVGVLTIVSGIIYATVLWASRWRHLPGDVQYRVYRRSLGRAILLGLEFLLAADIIRTVALDPSWQAVGVLAVIVVIRTFLSLELEMELEGRWPWQQGVPPTAERNEG